MGSAVDHAVHETALHAQGLSVRVLTLNTHKGFSIFNRRHILPELREAVRSSAADIVFLQEVLGEHERHRLRFPDWPANSQYEFLADSIWTDFAYGRNAVYPHGHHGNAVLSKFPIQRYENRDVSMSRDERRGLLHCVLQMPKRELHVFCVHLGLLEAHRIRQLHLLAQMIDAEVPKDAPLIVAGDFNDWRLRGHSLLAHRCGMHEVFADSNGRPARTFPARWPTLRLDRIYVRHMCIVDREVLAVRPWSHLSDHAALVSEVLL